MKLVYSLLLQYCAITGSAQSFPKDSSKLISINVEVVNPKQVPLPKEEVLFINQKNQQKTTGISDRYGKIKIQLEGGNTYLIKIRTLIDTSTYTILELPVPQRNEYSLKSYTITIEYEPAKVYILKNVLFDTNRFSLRPSCYQQLNSIAEYMKWKENETYQIAGHTDSRGNATINNELSQQRAEAVKNYLVQKGVAANRLMAKGYGGTKPIMDNSTSNGRQTNRRTEIIIEESKK